MSLTRSSNTTDPSLKELYELIDHPISCGYLHVKRTFLEISFFPFFFLFSLHISYFLLFFYIYKKAFCESEYSAENIKYIIEINTFRDFFRIDRVAWSKSYKVLDLELKDLSDEEIDHTWPSQYLSESSIREKIDRIYSLFIDNNAELQICFPHVVLERTMTRLNLINYYGPEAFEESLIDPLKTMKRDILPRFLRSNYYSELSFRLKSIETLPSASELEIPIPPTNLSFDPSQLSSERRFHLHEVVECRLLYTKFLSYLQGCFCSENLICYRMISLFEEKMITKQSVTSITWDIYRFFVAEGSAFEISLEYSNRKAILLQLAKPKIDCFAMVKKSAYSMLKTYFTSYKNTTEYQELASFILSKQNGKSNLFRACFP